MRGEEGRELKGMAELECQECKGPDQSFLSYQVEGEGEGMGVVVKLSQTVRCPF